MSNSNKGLLIMPGKIERWLGQNKLLNGVCGALRRLFFRVLAVGPLPRHIAFILDGNRRYGRKHKLKLDEAYQYGYFNFTSTLRYCFEMGVRCVTIYAFSIDNFRRKPTEVQLLMDLFLEKLESVIQEVNTVNELGIRIEFLGRLELLDEPIKAAAEKAMAATAKNSKLLLLVCVAYTSTDEITRGIQGAARSHFEKKKKMNININNNENIFNDCVTLDEVDGKMDFAGKIEPDILIRTSGETRLSNFLLWQTSTCLLFASKRLWPEFGLVQLVWAVLEYQRKYWFLKKIKKRL